MMKTRNIAILFLGMVICVISVGAAFAQSKDAGYTVNLSSQDNEVSKGEPFTVDLEVKDRRTPVSRFEVVVTSPNNPNIEYARSTATMISNHWSTNVALPEYMPEGDYTLKVYAYDSKNAPIQDSEQEVNIRVRASQRQLDLTGTWQCNWGTLNLRQSGSHLTGTFTKDSGRVSGRIYNDRVELEWSKAPTYRGPDDAGRVTARVKSKGSLLDGESRTQGGAVSRWEARKI